MKDGSERGDPIIPAVHSAPHTIIDCHPSLFHSKEECDVTLIEIIAITAIGEPSHAPQPVDLLIRGLLHKCSGIIGYKRIGIILIALSHLALFWIPHNPADGTGCTIEFGMLLSV